MRDRAKGIGKFQEQHVKVCSLLLGNLDLIPDSASVFQVPREAGEPCYQNSFVLSVSLQVS